MTGNNSFPGVTSGANGNLDSAGKSKNNSLLLIGGVVVLVLLIAGAITALSVDASELNHRHPGRQW